MTRCSSSTAATSSRPRATSCGRARRCRGSIPACSARSASAAASRSAPRSCGRAGRSGSCGATARARTRSPSSTRYVRHGVAPIAVIGNDASWMQIAREQVEVLGTSLGTDLRRTDYHKVAEGYGGVGLLLTDPARVDSTLAEAKAIAKRRPAGLHQRAPAQDRLPQGLDLDVIRAHARLAAKALDCREIENYFQSRKCDVLL